MCEFKNKYSTWRFDNGRFLSAGRFSAQGTTELRLQRFVILMMLAALLAPVFWPAQHCAGG
jgi:hypothetical protein